MNTVPALAANTDAVRKELAPSGRLRVAINLGNNVLAQRNADGCLAGVSVALARRLAATLSLPFDLIAFPSAGEVFASIRPRKIDLCFLAIEPKRQTELLFTPPYVYLDGTYLVRKDSAFHNVADLDKPGVTIGVGDGAAYDLYLSERLHHAQLVRATTSPGAVDLMLSRHLDAAAGVRQYLDLRAKDHPDLRVLPDNFQRIEQAMSVPKPRVLAARYLGAFLEDMQKSGVVKRALDESGQTNATIAPPA